MSFEDKVRGPPSFHFYKSLWIAEARPRRGAGVHPDVQNVRFSPCVSPAFASDPYLVDAISVEFKLFGRVQSEFDKFCLRADHGMFPALLAGPHWQRHAPVALARYYPISSAFQPVVEPLGPGPFWHPSDLRVFAQHFFLDRGDFDKPLVCGSKDEGCFASPAVRVRVLDCLLFPKKILGLEILDDDTVCVPNR